MAIAETYKPHAWWRQFTVAVNEKVGQFLGHGVFQTFQFLYITLCNLLYIVHVKVLINVGAFIRKLTQSSMRLVLLLDLVILRVFILSGFFILG